MHALLLLLVAQVGDTAPPLPMSSSVTGARQAWADFDGDRLPDLLSVTPGGDLALLWNAGDGTFQDASSRLPDEVRSDVASVQWRDLDGDGRADVLVLQRSGAAWLLRNDGDTLRDSTALADTGTASPVRGAQWFDYDADGRIDLLLATDAGPALLHGLGGFAFQPVELPARDPLVPVPSGAAGGSTAPDASAASAAQPGSGTAPISMTTAPTRAAGASGALVDTTRGNDSTPALAPQPGGASLDPSSSANAMASALCVSFLNDVATGACLTASSNPVLGALYPLSTNFFVTSAGRVGFGTTQPAGDVGLGVYQGGTAGSGVAAFSKQLVLGGGYNVGANGATGVKLLIADYDNDGNDTYPIYVEDENNFVDYYQRSQKGEPSSYFRGSVGIAGEPDLDIALNVEMHPDKDYGLWVKGLDSNSTNSPLTVTNQGSGASVAASNLEGPGIRAVGTTGVEAIGASYGVDASASNGPALRATQTGTGGSPAIRAVTEATGPTIVAISEHPTDPVAAQLWGALHVGRESSPPFAVFQRRGQMGVGTNDAGEIRLRDSVSHETVVIQAQEFGTPNGAQIQLFDGDGTATITMDADHSGSGRVLTQVLEITGGADIVENFDTYGDGLEPGTVVVADVERPGAVLSASSPYARAVLGVVSGAGGVRPGLRLGQEGVLDGEIPVALSGRVYVRATTENGAIQPGDLLTSSSLAGHAMRADDPGRAFGAVLGKALSKLDGETGLVLVLVGLQ